MYGGRDVNANVLATVELLSVNGSTWQTLPTPMYQADYCFSSVSFGIVNKKTSAVMERKI